MNGFVHTYKVSVSDESATTNGTIVFQNAGDTSKETTLTLTVAEPKMTFEKSTDTNNAATWDEGSSMLKIDLDALEMVLATSKSMLRLGIDCESGLPVGENH